MKVKPSVGVKALVIEDNKLITICKEDEQGYFYSFPGGGQEKYETLVEAVKREFLEEVGVEIEVDTLLCVREFISKNHSNASSTEDIHVVDHIFLCNLKESALDFANTVKLNPDPGQVRIEWLALDGLSRYRFYPKALIPFLLEIGRGNKQALPFYVGDVN